MPFMIRADTLRCQPNSVQRMIRLFSLAMVLSIVPLLVKAEQLEVPMQPPTKGELISELKEESSSTEGATVVRVYEDSAGNRVREFSMRGAVFQYEVSPKDGPRYFLIDNDGDGLFESRFHGYEPRIMVPQWALFQF
ncbi:MAG: DUF2782 domain-containing protein [Magnetococcales bacterium]|nr:DUF2782 domain-containing protein [Magnetococcales bacterium]